MLKRKPSDLWIIVAVMLILWGLLLFRIDGLFFGHHESSYIWISAAVRVFNQYGPEATNFLPIRTPGPATPETGLYYLHHPPLMVWFSYIATQLFGYYPDTLAPYESSMRMLGIIAAILTLPLFYTLARRLTSARIALIGFLFYASAPVTIYYGRMSYYDMLVMPVVLAFVYHFTLWMETYTVRRTLLLVALGVFAMWIAWAAGFFFAVFGVIALIYGTRQHRVGIVGIGLIVGLATLAIPLLYQTLREDAFTQLINAIILRTSNEKFFTEGETFTVGEFIAQYIYHMLTMVSVAVLVLGIIGIIMLVGRKKSLSVVILLGLVAAPLLFMLVARSAFHFHDWYKVHYLPGFAIAAAIASVALWQLKPEGIKIYAKPFIVAIIVCTIPNTLYWVFSFHQATYEPFGRNIASELPLYTEADDFIASNHTIKNVPAEYYAYRTIRWGISIEEVIRYYNEQETVDLFYLLCLSPETVNSYDGDLSEYDYVVIAGECRLIHLEK